LARGEYVYGAAADDKVLPGFFAETLTMAAEHPEAGILFGDVVKADDAGNLLAYFGLSRRKESTYFTPKSFLDDYLAVEPPGHSLCGATIYRRDRLLEMGGYRDGLGSWVDTFVARAIGLKYGACYIPQPFLQWRYAPNSLAHGTTTWEALRIAQRAARQMRSPRFRDCFPESYVRNWVESYRSCLLRERLAQMPQRREEAFLCAEARIERARARVKGIKQSTVLGLPLRAIPRLEERLLRAITNSLRRRAEHRLRRVEKYLHRQLDPAICRAGPARRLCESIALPAQVLTLSPSMIASDGGHGYRVDLGGQRLFVPSDQESVSLLRVLENGKSLNRPHHPHEAIREQGEGRFSHWANFLYFSSSDNSDPRCNGREYALVTPRSLWSLFRSIGRKWRGRGSPELPPQPAVCDRSHDDLEKSLR
jgi:hypothetical protein